MCRGGCPLPLDVISVRGVDGGRFGWSGSRRASRPDSDWRPELLHRLLHPPALRVMRWGEQIARAAEALDMLIQMQQEDG